MLPVGRKQRRLLLASKARGKYLSTSLNLVPWVVT
jgi:hypothetical protein